MKRTRYISLIIALLSVLSITAQQQQSQYALYNYRNDGDFNAWLNIDIDSITYSNISIDSIEYDNIVTQEVWTPDSCYRISLEVIDSIGFRAPEPEFKEGIFHITEDHIPYTIDVDSLTITFDSSISISMLPAVGQVVISDVYGEPFEKGFAGRVMNIVYVDGTTRIECEAVGLEDVYDQLIFVGKTIAYEDDDDVYSSRRKSPRKIKINEDGTLELPLGKFSIDLFTKKEMDQYTQQPTGDKTNYVKVTAKPSLIFDYIIRYNVKGQENAFKCVLSTKSETELDLKWPKSVKPVDWEKYLDTFIPIPTGVLGLYSKICFGAYFQIEGDARLEAKFPFTFQKNVGIDTQSDNLGGIIYSIQATNFEIPELSASLNASMSIGLAAKFVTCIVTEKLASANIKVKTGPKISGKIEVSTNGITDGGWSWYESMKDSKITIEPLVITVSGGMELFGKKKDWKYNLPMPDLDFLKKEERYLFPDFTKPELPHYLMPNPLDMRTTPHRDLIMPVYAGLGIYDEEGVQQRADYSAEKYQIDAYYKRPPHVFIGDLPVGQKFTCRPIFNFPGLPAIGEIKALPLTEFTVPEPMTIGLDTPLNSVTLKKGLVRYVAINDGWGEYSAQSSMEAICNADIEMFNGKPCVKLTASKFMTGSAVVTVKDLRSGETKTILVTVSDDAVPEELTISEQTVSLQEEDSTTVLITSGSGNYTAESSNENVATATIEDNVITIKAISAGPAFITVTDVETEETATIEVIVKADGQELILNGDFSHGNQGFTSDYTYVSETGDDALWPEGTYTVGTSPGLYHGDFKNYVDHTTGTGNMLIVNGSPNNTQYVWKQNVAVEKGKIYNLSAWLSAVSDATNNSFKNDIEYSVNGKIIPKAYSKTENNWECYSGEYTAIKTDKVEIKIRITTQDREGNDFAIDDISFIETGVDSIGIDEDIDFVADEGTHGFSSEDYYNLLDKNTSTKWCFNPNGTPGYVIFHTSKPIYVAGYRITTANDTESYPNRNPKSWTLYGSSNTSNPGKDGASWEIIDTVTDDTKLQGVNFTPFIYILPSETTKAYQYFMWVITEPTDGIIQVSDFYPFYKTVYDVGGGVSGGGGSSW